MWTQAEVDILDRFFIMPDKNHYAPPGERVLDEPISIRLAVVHPDHNTASLLICVSSGRN